MTVYAIRHHWGDANARWHDGGVLNIGNRADRHPVALRLDSEDGGHSMGGILAYADEPPCAVRALLVSANCYRVEQRPAGPQSPWRDAGLFLLGARFGQNPVTLDLLSRDAGYSFSGIMVYAGEGPIGIRGDHAQALVYTALNQWGDADGPWHPGGQWVLGSRDDAPVTALSIESIDRGATLIGTVTYGESVPVAFRAKRIMGDSFLVEDRSGEPGEPWLAAGTWVLGGRGGQGLAAVHVERDGDGLSGTMTYSGETPIAVSLIPSAACSMEQA